VCRWESIQRCSPWTLCTVCNHISTTAASLPTTSAFTPLPCMLLKHQQHMCCHQSRWWVAGADLDPLQVLGALSEEMPLSAGVDILSHLLCERLHRHRQGSIIRSLHKACSLSASVDRAEVCCCMYTAVTVTSQLRFDVNVGFDVFWLTFGMFGCSYYPGEL